MRVEDLEDARATARATLVASLRRHLLRHGLARFQMTVIAVATGLAGFATSATLLGLGMTSMARRYAGATAIAYAVFLLLVRLWAEHQCRRLAPGWSPPSLPSGRPRVRPGHRTDTDGLRPTAESRPSDSAVDLGDVGVSVLENVDLDELLLPLALLGSGLAAAVYVVAAAPVLLAEVLLDVVLVSGLYLRLRTLEPGWWLDTAVRRTWIPAVVVALVLAATGFVVQTFVPEVDSIGDVMPRSSP
jgi:hypothetical protein